MPLRMVRAIPSSLAWLLSLLLLMSACTKEKNEPTPAPELEGRWTYRSSDFYDYDKAGKVLVHLPKTFNPYFLEVTKQALIYRHFTTNAQTAVDVITLRKGDTLEMGPASLARQVIITQLTAHALTLQFYKWSSNPTNGSYGSFEDHYTR